MSLLTVAQDQYEFWTHTVQTEGLEAYLVGGKLMFSPEIISCPKNIGIFNKLAYAHANKVGIRDFSQFMSQYLPPTWQTSQPCSKHTLH